MKKSNLLNLYRGPEKLKTDLDAMGGVAIMLGFFSGTALVAFITMHWVWGILLAGGAVFFANVYGVVQTGVKHQVEEQDLLPSTADIGSQPSRSH